VAELSKVLETASRSGLNGAMLSSGLDSFCKQSPDYFRRLEELRKTSDRPGMEIIPAIFSVGYSGGVFSHNRHLAEGVSVEGAPFLVRDGQARLLPDAAVRIVNGGFEEHTPGARVYGRTGTLRDIRPRSLLLRCGHVSPQIESGVAVRPSTLPNSAAALHKASPLPLAVPRPEGSRQNRLSGSSLPESLNL